MDDLERQRQARAAAAAEQAGDVTEAIRMWQRAVELDPSWRPALVALSRLFARVQRWTDLVAVLERRVDLAASPEETRPLLVELRDIYRDRLGHASRAEELSQRLFDLGPCPGL